MAPDRERWILRKGIISTLTPRSQSGRGVEAGRAPLIDLHRTLRRRGEDLAGFPGRRCLKPCIIAGWSPKSIADILFLVMGLAEHPST